MTSMASLNCRRFNWSASFLSGLSKLPITVPRFSASRGDCAPTDPENGSAARNVVEGGKILCEAKGVPLGHDVDGHTDPDALRAFGDDRSRHQAVGDHLVAFVLEVVFGHPKRVVLEFLAEHRGVDYLFGSPPHLLVGGPTVGGCWRTGTNIFHLHSAQHENSGAHSTMKYDGPDPALGPKVPTTNHSETTSTKKNPETAWPAGPHKLRDS